MLVIRNGYVCTGIIDKNHIGESEFGLVHAFHELYGETAAAQLLTSLGRVLTMYLQMIGFSCTMDDLQLKFSANKIQKDWFLSLKEAAVSSACETLNIQKPEDLSPNPEIMHGI